MQVAEIQAEKTQEFNERLLGHLHRGGAFGFFQFYHTEETYTDKNGNEQRSKNAVWWEVGKAPTLLKMDKAIRKNDIYFGVNPSTTKRNNRQRSIIAEIAAVNCFYAEFDAKDFNGSKESTLAHIDSLPYAPSVIIDSGGGFHCYWLLRDTVIVTDENRKDVINNQRAWVEFVGGDDGAKDISRILRIPGTLNHKPEYGEPRPVEYVRTAWARTFKYDDLCIDLAEIVKGYDTKTETTPTADAEAVSVNLDDEAIKEKMFAASNGAKMQALWNGDMSAYGNNQNRADGGLCFGLAFYTKDAGQIDRLFRQSDLMRPKWDEIHYANGDTYGQKTIADAVAMVTETYTPGRNGTGPGAAGYDGQDTDGILSALGGADAVGEIINRIEEIVEREEHENPQNFARTELAHAIGQLDRGYHHEIEAELVNALGLTKTDAKEYIRACVADAKEAKKEKAEQERTAKAQRVRADEKTIDVAQKQFDEICDEAIAAMVRHVKDNPTNPTAYVRGGALAWVATDENKNKTIALYDGGSLKLFLARVANWVRVTESEDDVKVADVYPPGDVVRSLLSIGNMPGIPGIDGIVTAPVFGQGGHLHTAAGYDAETRLYFAKNGLKIGDTEPTSANVTAAKKLIFEHLLKDFPFKDDDNASKAHAVALLLLGFVRPMIDGPTPLHLIDSPTPGSGKGLLASACTMPAMGPNLPSTSAGRDDDEWRKRLTSALMGGANVINIDNVTEKLDSGVLASAITQPVWEDRVLGSSNNVRIKIRNIWIATGNNTALSQEISRRCVWIRLDSNMEKPWERDNFTHADLLSWAAKNRGELATAAITIIQSWVANGQKDFTGRVKGSFSAWSNVIGGILENAEIPGFLGNEAELYDTTVKGTSALVEFVKAWAAKYPKKGQEVNASDLFRLASYPDDLKEIELNPGEWLGLLDDDLGAGNQRSRAIKLGNLLTSNRDKVIEGHKITLGKPNRNGSTYILAKPEPQAQSQNTYSNDLGL